MNTAPQVSVITPSYNRADCLLRAITSVLRQTFADFEMIIVDDCSSDRTPQLVQEFRDPRISYVRLTENQGAAGARNVGIQKAKGQYLAFLDSDDEWCQDKLEKQIRLLENGPASVGAVFSWARVYPSGRILNLSLPEDPDKAFRALLRKNVLGTFSSALVRRVCFETIGVFDGRTCPREDYDLWLRLSRLYRIRIIAEPLVTIHTSSNARISKNLETKERASEIINDKLKALVSPDEMRKRVAREKAQWGYLYCLFGQTRIGRGKIVEAARTDPRYAKAWLYLLVAFLPVRLANRLRLFFRGYQPLE